MALACRVAAAADGGAGADGAADEIHFTVMGPTSVAFDWRGSATTLHYWSTPGQVLRVEAGGPTPLPVSSAGPFREAVVSGLLPGVTYHYFIGDGGGAGDHTFRAAGARADFVVAALGDIGASSGQPGAARVQRLVADAHPALVLVLGDLSYADVDRATPAAVDRHFNDVMVWSQDAAYMPAWGNHEWGNPARDDLRNYKGRFALPNAQASPGAPAAGCCGEDWYWFDYGDVRFIIYPEPYAPATWSDWGARAAPIFQAAEADPRITFIVTAGHRAAYSSGHHGGEGPLREILNGFGHRFSKYVLNLNGHSHDYERTSSRKGVVHVTAGIGGGALEHGPTACLWDDCTPPRWTVRRAIHHGFLRLRFTAATIEGTAVCGPPAPGEDEIHCAEGEAFDRFTISARSSPAAP